MSITSCTLPLRCKISVKIISHCGTIRTSSFMTFYASLHMEACRSRYAQWVGLIPVYAVLTFEPVVLRNWAEVYQRIQWFVQRRPELSEVLKRMLQRGT